MKRFTGALLIAGLLFYLTASVEKKMEKSCNDISSVLEICASHIKSEEYAEALDVLEGIEEEWNKNKFITGVITGDVNFRNTGIDISTVYNCINDKNYSQALLVIRKIQSCFKQAVEDRRFTPANIL